MATPTWLHQLTRFASRSIRGGLVVWVAVLLMGVLTFFGGLLYETNRRLTIERIDAEMRSFGISILAAGRFPFRPPFNDREGRGRPEVEPLDHPVPPGENPPPHRDRQQPADREPPDFNNRDRRDFDHRIPGDQGPGPGSGGRLHDRRGPPDRMFFILRRGEDGDVIDQSFDLPAETLQPFPEIVVKGPIHPRDSFQVRQTGARREMKLMDPGRTKSVVVGRFIQREWDDLQRLLVWTAIIAIISLAIGIVGTWLLAHHVLKPLEEISNTVTTLTASRLDRRIDVAPLKAELQSVARELNATFDRLQEGFARQVQFTSDASHELRTPIAVILAQTEHALSRERTAEDYRLALEACHRSASRMRTLVESLLALARADSGRLQLANEPVDLVPVVEHAIASVMPRAVAAQINIATQLSSVLIRGDAVFLGQVIINLLANAIEYNQPGGMIFVTLAADAEHARLSVADTGRGMSTEERSHLFERFFRADSARTASGTTGHGLGLAICHEIMELHNGRIDVSTELGRGSTFCLVLPRYQQEALPSSNSQEADSLNPPH